MQRSDVFRAPDRKTWLPLRLTYWENSAKYDQYSSKFQWALSGATSAKETYLGTLNKLIAALDTEKTRQHVQLKEDELTVVLPKDYPFEPPFTKMEHMPIIAWLSPATAEAKAAATAAPASSSSAKKAKHGEEGAAWAPAMWRGGWWE